MTIYRHRIVRLLSVVLFVTGVGTAPLYAQRGKPTTPPTVSITAPVNGATFTAPANISISATAADPDGSLKFVKFYAGSNQLCNVTRAPYTCAWSAVPAATYVLTAIATDNNGASATSAPVTITVKTQPAVAAPAPTPAPTVSLSSPSSGSSFVAPANIQIGAQVSGGTIAKVVFYAGSAIVGTLTASPWTVAWNNVAAGSYSLTAVVTDSTGQTATSASVPVTVTPPPNVAPTVTLTSPANGGSYTAPASITLTASASDSDGTVTQVAFFVGSTNVATMLSSPYTFNWSGVAAGSYSITAIATDNSGASTTSAAVGVTVAAAAPVSTTDLLVQQKNLVYQGSFRVPDGTFGSTIISGTNVAQFNYGGTAIGFNPAHNSLYMVGHDWGQLVAEISIPQIRASSNITDLATASVLQPFADPTNGTLSMVHPGGSIKIGGLFPYQNELYVSAFDYYDGANQQVTSHFITAPTFGSQSSLGPFQVTAPMTGFVDGYFGTVPSAWQAAFHGPVIGGNCCLNVVSRTSWGPALFAFDPTKLGVTNPLPSTSLVYYPSSAPLSAWDSTSTLFNGTSEVRGVVFPEGTRSVLFFGRQGTGTFCYGYGVNDPNSPLLGTPIDPSNPSAGVYCYDPAGADKGTHAYPYVYYVWAYNAGDLANVASGQATPWSVRPYATWQLTLPFANLNQEIVGAAYDRTTGRIFVSQSRGDYSLPLVDVFAIQP